ncbi:hypothetical protein E6O75_ATG02046 [Venturia nashicola]|uniref:Uncharacterized protein n=1 Tax=Venturia nashicola TaxID=86259 RepID=A0A4Z1PKH9_9PEZI|nr:hypothetical protein E6O75_ATG02046 [Venturia nashicola]
MLHFLPLILLSPFPFSLALPKSLVAKSTNAACDLDDVYRIMNSTLTEFMDLFHSPNRPDCYHWCTNGCSMSPDSWIGVDPLTKISFKPACARHDFSWHNLKKFGAFNSGNKLNADDHLRSGMMELCGKHEVCGNDVATLYYSAVRLNQEPAERYNKWGPEEVSKQLDCTVFPGCCSNHNDANKCGEERLPGQFKGDKSCAAR